MSELSKEAEGGDLSRVTSQDVTLRELASPPARFPRHGEFEKIFVTDFPQTM